MTTTRAIYTFETIRAKFSADLIVFDESSQVGQAHALALLPLGKKALFTGDPEQLAPIVNCKEERVQEWLGKSMFANQKHFTEATCFLAEQSRMAEPICQIVSKIFYKGSLKVAGGCGIAWHDERDIRSSRVEPNHVSAKNISQGANYSPQYGGWIRYESAKLINDLVLRFQDSYELTSGKILILTPFRAQRHLIRAFFKNSKIKGVKVSTVHRAQGGECHTVIFDPVDADNEFLKTEDARRLVNVAVSRAKARLIVCISENDLKNPVFQKVNDFIKNISKIVEMGSKTGNLRQEIEKDYKFLIFHQDFPKNALKKEISIPSRNGDIVGKITEVLDEGLNFKLFVYKTGEYETFRTKFVKKNALG